MEWLTDRSRILTRQTCPRKYFYAYAFQGTGIEKKSKSLALHFGGAFHEGTEILLTTQDIEAAVSRAVEYIDAKFAAAGVELDAQGVLPTNIDAMTEHSISEQKAIAAGLLRAWWAYRGQQFMAEYEVLEVEREGRAELADGVVLMFRPDALVRERATGDIFVISWKTASTFGTWTVNSSKVDMQSMSEVWGRLNANEEPLVGFDAQLTEDGRMEAVTPRIEGVLYIYTVKGQRRMDNWLGFKTQSTHLAYGWKKAGATPDDDEWAWAYSYVDEDSGRDTKLGKGWKKVLVSREYPGGVKGWIEALAEHEVRPRHVDAFESVFPQSLAVERRVDEIESWRVQVQIQETEVQHKVAAAREWEWEKGRMAATALDMNFPQYTHSCYSFNSPCPYHDICFNPAVAQDPMSSGLYQIRQANHPEKGDGDD